LGKEDEGPRDAQREESTTDDNVIQFPGRGPEEGSGGRDQDGASPAAPTGARFAGVIAADDANGVLRSGWLTQGKHAQDLRQRAADVLGSREIVPVAGGSAALHLALLTLELQHGDEVIIPSLAHPGLATLVALAGGRPVLADIVAPELPLLDPADTEARIGDAARAILVAHTHGHPAPLPEFMRLAEGHGLALIEDCSHALGARLDGRPVGTFGRLGVFALQPQPDGGGLIVCADADMRRRLEGLRSRVTQPGDDAFEHSFDITLANGYRIDEAAAAEGVRRLDRLDDELRERRSLVARAQAMTGGDLQAAFADGYPAGAESAAEVFALLAPSADRARELLARCRASGLQANRPLALHHTAPFSHQLPRIDLPQTDAYLARAVELPVDPALLALETLTL
jgi:perosamine synthetase